jgi:hypothetical protein
MVDELLLPVDAQYGPPPRPRTAVDARTRTLLMLMSNAVTPTTPEAELRANPNLGLSLGSPSPVLRGGERATRLINVPAALAEFLIEAFAADQEPALQGWARKSFPDPTIIHIRLPDPVPMSFQSINPETIQIGLYQQEEEAAIALESRISGVLNAMSQREIFVAELTDIAAQNFPDTAIDSLRSELQLPMLRLTRTVNPTTQRKTCLVKIMKVASLWNSAVEARLHAVLERAFERACLSVCKFCALQFCLSDCGRCEELYHIGKQIQFPNGAWEEEGTLNGHRATYLFFSCCGKVLPYSGCRTRVRSTHYAEDTISRLHFDIYPAYPPNPKYQ